MNTHTIGEITLSLSTIVYFFWFVPQLILNYERKSTEGFSLWMHGLLLIGYTADLLYGFGRHMQWQYRLVTVSGLLFLLIEHAQIARYDCRTRIQKLNFSALTVFVLALLFYAILNFTLLHHSQHYYNLAGFVSDVCWMTFIIPQIIKNYQLKSTEGLSRWFVILSIVLSVLDITSTFTLNWAWPSVLAVSITLFKKAILVFQMIYYRASSDDKV